MMSLVDERMEKLLDRAERKASEGSLTEARDLVNRAKSLSLKENRSIPEKYRKNICRECNSFLKPGKNAKVRLNSEKKNVNYVCENCGGVNRYGF